MGDGSNVKRLTEQWRHQRCTAVHGVPRRFFPCLLCCCQHRRPKPGRKQPEGLCNVPVALTGYLICRELLLAGLHGTDRSLARPGTQPSHPNTQGPKTKACPVVGCALEYTSQAGTESKSAGQTSCVYIWLGNESPIALGLKSILKSRCQGLPEQSPGLLDS